METVMRYHHFEADFLSHPVVSLRKSWINLAIKTAGALRGVLQGSSRQGQWMVFPSTKAQLKSSGADPALAEVGPFFVQQQLGF